MYLQRTIRQRVAVDGIGLHTGEPARIVFRPAPPDTGIYVLRGDLPGTPSIRVHAENVSATSLATTLSSSAFSVSTVEHCLSALAAYRIDNLYIELDGPEIPIGDGSAKTFLDALLSVGFVEQEEPRRYLYVTEPVFYGEGEKHAYVVPYSGLRVTCVIEFAHGAIGKQRIDVDINETSFAREIAGARTFGFLKDVEAMRSRGLARGGSLDNAIVLDDQGVMNPGGLRFADEFVRHKVLDALGDLVTLGRPLLGHVVLHKAGHDVMNKLARKLLQSTDRWREMQLGGEYAWAGKY
ncbi:MAG TPA: UDP-3-O-acyl-N-acetylglucosamine deacetylase [Pseudobdellovibrionaceae bacterium]|nr:UDP-3-O-acyl-N-acetylglucosamine deacetylase [Pseudobdellovibrionaceae bacterium]